jgi:RNA polymerase sigma-70 factor, ECF subfamily
MAKSSQAIVSIVAAQISDDELVARSRDDPGAFADLYDRYLPQVYRYLFSRVSSQAEAEDLTSQVFLAALEAFPRYRHQGYFNAWLFSIARRKVADHYRRPNSDFPLERARVQETSLHNLLVEIIQKDELRRLAELITKLNDQEQDLLRLRFAAQLGFAEIARLLNRTEGAVKMSLYRLLQQLESLMEANDE